MTIVMGVLNVTPDSFSDGGAYVTTAAAVRRGEALIAQGAGIVDIGGESTRPGAEPVPRIEELGRVIPVIRGLADTCAAKGAGAGATISIDTIHAETAEAAVAAGARIINDVSGGLHDPAMLEVAARASAEHGARFVIGHWRGIPDPAHARSDYDNVVVEVRNALDRLARSAIGAGVAPEHIIVDPGLGFDKTGEQCWQLLAHLDALARLGYPVLVGASRKRMIAEALSTVPEPARGAGGPLGRDLATSVVSAFAARAGAWGVRVHDVASTVQALAVHEAWSAASAASAGEPRPAAARVPGGRSIGETRRETRHAAPCGHRDPCGHDEAGWHDEAGDRIVLTGLEVFAHHGVFDFERETGQRFLVDAELSLDLRAAAEGDALDRTVHYGELAEAIVAAVERDPVDLIETVAERVADVALGFAGVRSVRATVHKPDAPIRAAFADVSVSVLRHADAGAGAGAGACAGAGAPVASCCDTRAPRDGQADPTAGEPR